MKPLTIRTLTACLSLAVVPTVSLAQEDPGVDRLREALRQTTVQLRQAQSDLAAARADNVRLEEENAQLNRRVETLLRQASEDQAVMQQSIRELRADLQDKEAEAKRLADTLIDWQRRFDVLSSNLASAQETIGERDRTQVELRREIAQLRSQNRELHRLGLEILERFENFSFGRALGAREPFIGVSRARLQTLVQDYRDEINDNRIRLDPQ